MGLSMIDKISLHKLEQLKNRKVMEIVEKYANLCKPRSVRVFSDSVEDILYLRNLSKINKEESQLTLKGHTVHFDGFYDQGRDKENTRILLPKGKKLSRTINTIDKETGLNEMFSLLEGIMQGKEMLVCFFCLGPNNSIFSIPALQITDSAYVAHSETILYRPGYEQFRSLNNKADFFHFVHSSGELDGRMNSRNIEKRRIYMDLEEERVFTINNQYAGNSVGLKKLALRLAISKADREEWLCEHMLVMGLRVPGKSRTTYVAGAFPSACGKTSTAMIQGQTIIGDDIAYIRPGEDGAAYAVNVEQGIFGIIQDVNPVDDPLIYKTITTPREIIFSNVLVNNGEPYWLGMGREIPDYGINYAGEFNKGMEKDGKPVLPAHKNARYTIRLSELENVDPNHNNPNGVALSGIIYGGRDSDTSPPVVESLSWSHGVFVGAALESETTAATIGDEGVRKHNPMANQDFLVIPLGKYIENHVKFGEALDKLPRIFATNYFLRANGAFLNSKTDKKVWLYWMEGRIHNEYSAIETPIGFIPQYEDLKGLFMRIFNKPYTREDYIMQFSIRVAKLLERLQRIEAIYHKEEDVPKIFLSHIVQQKQRLIEARNKVNKDTISPFDLKC